MSQHAIRLKVFVASPSDVEAERKRVQEVIKEVNRALSNQVDIDLVYVGWELNTWPAFGSDPQAVINAQIGTYDIFVGILWTRLGTPTPRAASGTVEEFEQAFQWWSTHRAVDIMLYFGHAGQYPPTSKDARQLEKVIKFREKVSSLGGYYWKYNGPPDFERQFRAHLFQVALNRQDNIMLPHLRSTLAATVRSTLKVPPSRSSTWVTALDVIRQWLPDIELHLFLCDPVSPSEMFYHTTTCSQLDPRFKLTWQIHESPFMSPSPLDLNTLLMVEVRSPANQLKGYLIAEKVQRGQNLTTNFTYKEYTILIALAAEIGYLL